MEIEIKTERRRQRERDRERQRERERERERESVCFFIPLGLYYLGFGRYQVLIQMNQSTPKLSWPFDRSTPLLD